MLLKPIKHSVNTAGGQDNIAALGAKHSFDSLCQGVYSQIEPPARIFIKTKLFCY
jgi:hypothetical protein